MTRGALSDHLPEVLPEVRRLRARFAATAAHSWDATTAAAELSVQLGHLSLCLLRKNGTDISTLEDPQRPLADPGDELADVVLAALSINVLAGSEPITTHPTAAASASDDVEPFLRLIVAAGALSEAALVQGQYRHQPTGTPPSLAEAAAAVINACDALADQLGMDLISEFRSMVADADSFLENRRDAS